MLMSMSDKTDQSFAINSRASVELIGLREDRASQNRQVDG